MSETQKRYNRFSIWERVEHVVLVLSFTLLGVTGIPQKYPLASVSQFVIDLLGGIETTRIIHRIAATVFVLEAVYHLIIVGYKLYIQRKEATMLPGVKDGVDAYQWIMRNLGLSKEGPRMPRYNFMEKAEYWAMLWGFFVMALTGFMLWNPIATTNLLPGEFIPAAKAAHGGEAVLAVLAIILWHFYHVHIKQFNWSMIRGTLSRHEMEEEHGAELAKIEAGLLPQAPGPEERRRRLMIFAPLAAVTTVAMLAAVTFFVTFETSSVTTIPTPEADVPAFVPVTPTPGVVKEIPTVEGGPGEAAVAWDGVVGAMLAENCASCHGSMGDYSVETYSDAMTAVEPGNPDASSLVEVQLAGDHPGQLTDDQISTIVAWIEAGAPETGPAGEGGGQTGGGELTWSGGIETVFADNCAACHGSMGGFSAETYDDVMAGVEPGDPDASSVVEVQRAGDHPGMFSPEDLDRVIDWIQAGAPQ